MARYMVDWDDQAYPNIVVADEDDPGGQSFTACKREIIERARIERDHWLMIIHQVRATKRGDLDG